MLTPLVQGKRISEGSVEYRISRRFMGENT
jgi:hypothetical protein